MTVCPSSAKHAAETPFDYWPQALRHVSAAGKPVVQLGNQRKAGSSRKLPGANRHRPVCDGVDNLRRWPGLRQQAERHRGDRSATARVPDIQEALHSTRSATVGGRKLLTPDDSLMSERHEPKGPVAWRPGHVPEKQKFPADRVSDGVHSEHQNVR